MSRNRVHKSGAGTQSGAHIHDVTKNSPFLNISSLERYKKGNTCSQPFFLGHIQSSLHPSPLSGALLCCCSTCSRNGRERCCALGGKASTSDPQLERRQRELLAHRIQSCCRQAEPICCSRHVSVPTEPVKSCSSIVHHAPPRKRSRRR